MVQVKHTIKTVDLKAIQEIVAAKKYYDQIKQVSFSLKVVTNGEFTLAAKDLATSNDVELISRLELFLLQQVYHLTEKEVNDREMSRERR